MLKRPPACFGCALNEKATGYAPPEGPDNAPIVLLGEALGPDEAKAGRPFVGAAGSMLSRILTMLGWDRASLKIVNTIACMPPGMWLDGAPWAYHAITHCRVHREPALASARVIVPMGAVAIKTVLGLSSKKVGPQNFHGTVTEMTNGQLVVPTFHPSFLQRGAHNLIGTVIWDLQQAEKAKQHGRPNDPATLVVDPPLDWFTTWVSTVRAACTADPSAYPISVDVETPDKAHGRDEGEITAEDRSFQILRVNLACHPDEGVTVPFAGPYIDALKRLLAPPAVLWLWNKEYDIPRLVAAETVDASVEARAIDLMWLWHFLQSDLPRGLGFVAPFYSAFGAWKHLADSDPAGYGAGDGLQTHRVGFGVLGDLHRLGMYAMAERHVHALHHLVLKPAQIVGVKIDRERLLAFKAQLTEKATERLDKLQSLFPAELRTLSPKQGLAKRPAENVLHVKATAFTRKGTERKGKPASEIKLDLYKRAEIIERTIEKEVLCCATCGDLEVQRRHRCKSGPASDRATEGGATEQLPDLVLETRRVVRWFWSEPFNPDSWQQVLAYIKATGQQPGRAKKTYKDTTDRETLEKLQRTGDPFYGLLLDYRAIGKVKGTYVDGTERRLDPEDRVHPEPTFKPSTHRLSYVNPNITNVVQDRGGAQSLAAGYRHCVVASPGCRLLEVDFSSSESVDTGWCAGDPVFIRLAKLGVHAALASHILKRPYNPAWSDADIGAYFKQIKKAPEGSPEQITYNRSKRFIHGFSYGLSVRGMVLQFPEIFPTMKVAEQYADLFRSLAPKIPAWQRRQRELAFRQHYLGGPGVHPFGYKHWFWSVYTYKRISAGQYWTLLKKYTGKEAEAPVTEINGQHFRVQLGEDGKRCIAFMPQSITAGKLKDVLLRLFTPGAPSYIGEAYHGRTPLRAPIHDSLLLEIPDAQFDWVASLVLVEMQKPFAEMPCPEAWGLGPYLATGVSAKVGRSWGSMEDLPITDLGVSTDRLGSLVDAEDEDDVSDLSRSIVA